eukprot:7963984-Alexandrium_andersonii.AAC.1
MSPIHNPANFATWSNMMWTVRCDNESASASATARGRKCKCQCVCVPAQVPNMPVDSCVGTR